MCHLMPLNVASLEIQKMNLILFPICRQIEKYLPYITKSNIYVNV